MQKIKEMDYVKPVDDFLTFLRTAESYRNCAEANMHEAEEQQCDIEHSMYLEEHTELEMENLTKALIETLKDRREAKDMMTSMDPIVDWASNNKTCVTSLQTLLGTLRKNKNKPAPMYRHRTDVLEKIKVQSDAEAEAKCKAEQSVFELKAQDRMDARKKAMRKHKSKDSKTKRFVRRLAK